MADEPQDPQNNVDDIEKGRELRWEKEEAERLKALEEGRLVDAVRRGAYRLRRKIPEPKLLTTYPFYIQEQARHILYGDTGIGKSLLAMLAAMHAAWNGYRVVYFAGESYQDEFDDRLQCLAHGFSQGRDVDHVIEVISDNLLDLCTSPFTLIDEEADLRELREELKPDLVIFDPYVTYSSGSENDVEAVRDFTVKLNQIFIAHGVGVLVVHHTGKGSDGKRPEHMRGSSHLPSWSQLTYRAGAVDIDDRTTRLLVECMKGRPKKKPPAIALERYLSEDMTRTTFSPIGQSSWEQEAAAQDLHDQLYGEHKHGKVTGKAPSTQHDSAPTNAPLTVPTKEDTVQDVDITFYTEHAPAYDTAHDSVLAFVQAHPGRYFTSKHVQQATGIKKTAANTALADLDNILNKYPKLAIEGHRSTWYLYPDTTETENIENQTDSEST